MDKLPRFIYCWLTDSEAFWSRVKDVLKGWFAEKLLEDVMKKLKEATTFHYTLVISGAGDDLLEVVNMVESVPQAVKEGIIVPSKGQIAVALEVLREKAF